MVDILDQFGQPIKKSEIATEPQTARTGHLQQEFAGHPSRGLTPFKLARILETAERGDLIAQADLFMDMEEKDGHIFAEMSKRKNALLTLDWQIKPPKNATPAEEEVAELVSDILDDLDLDEIIMDAADGIGKGYSCQEMTWHRPARLWYPKTIEHRPASWFTTAQQNQNELRLRSTGTDGEPLIPINWITHIHKSKTGAVSRGGIMRVLAWPYLFKNYSIRDLAEFLEIYGLPMRLGKYPNGATDREKSTLLQAVVNIGHSAAGIIPDSMMMEFMEAAKGASGPYESMTDWCERTQSKVILGATLTSQTDSGSGAFALGNVHNEVRKDIRDADSTQIGKTLTRQLVWPICMLNTALSPDRFPTFEFDTQEAEDLQRYAESIPKLVDTGLKIPVKWVHEKLQIPEPDGDEEVLQATTSQASTPPNDTDVKVKDAALTVNRQDEFDVLADAMGDEWLETTSPIIEPLLQLASTANNYAEFVEALPRLLEDEPTAMADLLARGNFMSRVYGMVKED